MTAPDWSAIAAWLTLAVAIAAAIFAGWQTLNAAADRRERQRPQVTVDLDPWPHHDGIIRLSIMNLGLTAAKNVRVRFEPPLSGETPADQEVIWDYLLRFVTRTWPYVPPGKVYECIFVNLPSYPEDAQRSWDVIIECEDLEGAQQNAVTTHIDLDDISSRTHPSTYGLHDLVTEAKETRKILNKLPLDNDGLHVVTETENDLAARRAGVRQAQWLPRYRMRKQLQPRPPDQ